MQHRMQPLIFQQACDLLKSAAPFKKLCDSGRYIVNCGIDTDGQDFILLCDVIDGPRIEYL